MTDDESDHDSRPLDALLDDQDEEDSKLPPYFGSDVSIDSGIESGPSDCDSWSSSLNDEGGSQDRVEDMDWEATGWNAMQFLDEAVEPLLDRVNHWLSNAAQTLVARFEARIAESAALPRKRKRPTAPDVKCGVYVLKLEKNKWYVGSSLNIEERIRCHRAGRGSAWTRKFKWVETESIRQMPADELTKEELGACLLQTLGFDFLRSRQSVDPPEAEIRMMRKLVCSKFNLCYECGNEGHMLPCPQNTQPAKWCLFEVSTSASQQSQYASQQNMGLPQLPVYDHKRRLGAMMTSFPAKDFGATCRLCGDRILDGEQIVTLERATEGLSADARPFYPQTGSVHGACFLSVRKGRIRSGLESGDERQFGQLELVPQFSGPAFQDPSPEQVEIYKWVCRERGNAIIDAKAGAAKSTTLLAALSIIAWTPNKPNQALKLWPLNRRPLILSFNKHNQEQLAKFAPRDASDVCTFHSMGLRVLKDPRNRKVELFKNAVRFEHKRDKVKKLVNNLIGQAVEQKQALRTDKELSRFVCELVNMAKCDALGVEADATRADWQNLYVAFKGTLERKLERCGSDRATLLDRGIDYAGRVLALSIQACFEPVQPFETPVIDFMDQVYMPVWFDYRNPDLLHFEPRPWVFVDEAQDINKANMLLLKRLIQPESGRLVAVGDPAQALYGFAGATSDGMGKLTEMFSAKVFPLSICWRCPRRHLDLAAALFKNQPSGAPVQPRDGAPAGLLEWDCLLDNIPDGGAAVLSRCNVHLIKLLRALMRRGHPVKLVGKEAIADKLVKTLKEVWNSVAATCSLTKPRALKDRLLAYGEQAVREAEAYPDESRIAPAKLKQDYLKCLCVLLKDLHHRPYATPEDMLSDLQEKVAATFGAKAEQSRGAQLLTLCTIHKAKGLEWDCVYLLEPDELFGLEEARAVLNSPAQKVRSVNDMADSEERNCTNVALTRSRKMLYILKKTVKDVDELLP